MSDIKYVREITEVRAMNNCLWMAVLEIALKTNPLETKKVLKKILDNDTRINERLKKLVG